MSASDTVFGVYQVSDASILSGFWISISIGSAFIVAFTFLQSRSILYRYRQESPSVTYRPPRLPQKGIAQYYGWLIYTFHTNDLEFLKSCGLDALMMVKVSSFGVQLFVPLTIVSMGILLPVNYTSGYLGSPDQSNYSSLFMQLTMANITPGSNVLWVHFFALYFFLLYAMWLLKWHFHQYLIIRQHYLRKGDAASLWSQVFKHTPSTRGQVSYGGELANRTRGHSAPANQFAKTVSTFIMYAKAAGWLGLKKEFQASSAEASLERGLEHAAAAEGGPSAQTSVSNLSIRRRHVGQNASFNVNPFRSAFVPFLRNASSYKDASPEVDHVQNPFTSVPCLALARSRSKERPHYSMGHVAVVGREGSGTGVEGEFEASKSRGSLVEKGSSRKSPSPYVAPMPSPALLGKSSGESQAEGTTSVIENPPFPPLVTPFGLRPLASAHHKRVMSAVTEEDAETSRTGGTNPSSFAVRNGGDDGDDAEEDHQDIRVEMLEEEKGEEERPNSSSERNSGGKGHTHVVLPPLEAGVVPFPNIQEAGPSHTHAASPWRTMFRCVPGKHKSSRSEFSFSMSGRNPEHKASKRHVSYLAQHGSIYDDAIHQELSFVDQQPTRRSSITSIDAAGMLPQWYAAVPSIARPKGKIPSRNRTTSSQPSLPQLPPSLANDLLCSNVEMEQPLALGASTLAPGADDEAQIGVHALDKPSVRLRKTVPILMGSGDMLDVAAEHYAVLVIDVKQPLYPELAARQQEEKSFDLFRAVPSVLRRVLEGWVFHEYGGQQAKASGNRPVTPLQSMPRHGSSVYPGNKDEPVKRQSVAADTQGAAGGSARELAASKQVGHSNRSFQSCESPQRGHQDTSTAESKQVDVARAQPRPTDGDAGEGVDGQRSLRPSLQGSDRPSTPSSTIEQSDRQSAPLLGTEGDGREGSPMPGIARADRQNTHVPGTEGVDRQCSPVTSTGETQETGGSVERSTPAMSPELADPDSVTVDAVVTATSIPQSVFMKPGLNPLFNSPDSPNIVVGSGEQLTAVPNGIHFGAPNLGDGDGEGPGHLALEIVPQEGGLNTPTRAEESPFLEERALRGENNEAGTSGSDDGNRLRGWALVRQAVFSGAVAALPSSAEYSVVTATFRRLFPYDFDRAIPVIRHKEVDQLLIQLDFHMGQYEFAREYRKHFGRHQLKKLGCCGVCGEQVDALEYHRTQVEQLRSKIIVARKNALEHAGTPSWVVLFKSQTAASIASQSLIHPEGNRLFKVRRAPGPEEVNWPTLWLSWAERETRSSLVFPLVVLVVLIPIGIFSGAINELDYLFCSNYRCQETNPLTGQTYIVDCTPNATAVIQPPITWPWYCSQANIWSRLMKHVLVGWVPALLVSLWQGMVLPMLLFFLVQGSGTCYSLSQLDRHIATCFFYFDIFNVFLGGIVGSSIVQIINSLIEYGPSELFNLLGEALPNASNFFLNLIVFRTFVSVPMRILTPHIGIRMYLVRRYVRFTKIWTRRDKALVYGSVSPRYGYDYGVLMLVYVIGLAFAVASPVIVGLSCIFFMMTWIFWRYALLYVYVRKYESGGLMWPFVFERIMICLLIFAIFTACVFVVKKAYVQAIIVLGTVPVMLYKFARYCWFRFQEGVGKLPLEYAHKAPLVSVDPTIYIPSPLLPAAKGWHPDWMKPWEGWAMAAYSF